MQTSNALLEEIREINWGLIDTMVGISEEDVGSGTVVRCSFGAVNIKSQYASAKVVYFLLISYYNSYVIGQDIT